MGVRNSTRMREIAGIALLLIGYVNGHGNMVYPYTWFDKYRFGMQSGYQCYASAHITEKGEVGSCMFFNNFTFIEEPTLDRSLRTYQNIVYNGIEFDFTKNNPWRAPGAAYIHSPCGVAGGNPYGCPEGQPGDNCAGGGFSYGPFAEDLEYPKASVTEWKRGSVVEAAWGIIANHGGGYSYRLCKVPAEGQSGLTEECFQKTPLKFHSDQQWVQYGEDVNQRVDFKAYRTDVGTTPPGSQWTRNPIPACAGSDGGYLLPTPICSDGTQFEPPLPGLEGYGEIVSAPGTPTFMFSIGDYLEVPEDLEAGDYVLSFRWDCEQTSQVWATCSNIRITE